MHDKHHGVIIDMSIFSHMAEFSTITLCLQVKLLVRLIYIYLHYTIHRENRVLQLPCKTDRRETCR